MLGVTPTDSNRLAVTFCTTELVMQWITGRLSLSLCQMDPICWGVRRDMASGVTKDTFENGIHMFEVIAEIKFFFDLRIAHRSRHLFIGFQ